MTRILVVEDSATQALSLRLALEDAGHTVEIATDGHAGLEAAQRNLPALVITDVVMPNMTGYDLCRAIKADPRSADVPVILLTALRDPVDIIRGLESGADNFITRPYRPEQLLARVDHMLQNRRMRAAGRSKDGVEVWFLGRNYVITSGKEQILDLLLSTFEDIVHTNLELEEKQAALERSNHELESFSYSVSHDLRAPLRAIDGFLEAIDEDYGERLEERGRDYLARVRSAARRMAQLIDDLLHLSRVGRAELRCETLDLSGLAADVAGELARASPGHPVDFAVQAGIVAHGDPHLLRLLLENLLGNAWKFSSKREHPHVQMGAARDDGELHVWIRDDGVGFDMQYADKLFVPFQRMHSESEYPGTGIGLATVQRIVHRHGGRVWAESAPDQGATFHFTLPRA
jgi:hypothetical protein